MGFIDVDTHIIECEASWDYFDPAERQYRPVPVEAAGKQMYVIGETLCRRFPTDGRGAGFGKEYSAAVTHLEDPAARIREMDALGIDIQVIISTNFIAAELEHPHAEAAVMRSWNRWMAERTAETHGRLRWVALAPARWLERAFEEIEFAREHGAVGIMMKGIHNGMFLSDPYFYPLYERLQDLDMTVVIHQGAVREHIEGLGITNFPSSMAASLHYSAVPMQGLYAVIASDLDRRFPRLRFAFVESGSTWLPFVFHHWRHARAALTPDSYVQTEAGPTRNIPAVDAKGLMAAHNVYVAVDTDDDIPYVASIVGGDRLMVATDFCHNDLTSDPLAHTVVRGRADVDERLGHQLTVANGRQAYGLPAGHNSIMIALFYSLLAG